MSDKEIQNALEAEESKVRVRHFLWEEGAKWLTRTFYAAVTAFILFIMTPFGENVLRIWNVPIIQEQNEKDAEDQRNRIEEESRQRYETIDKKMDLILEKIAEITGEDRITEQPEGMSYVKEPAYFGEPVTLVLFIGRTVIGSSCILKEIIPQFTDENDVTLSNPPRKPRTQLGPKVVRRQIELTQPEGMIAGRTAVHIQLEYDCNGETVFENTHKVFYYALSR